MLETIIARSTHDKESRIRFRIALPQNIFFIKSPKKDGLSVRIIGKPQVSFLFAVLLFMSIFLSWIKQQDLAVAILYKSFNIAST